MKINVEELSSLERKLSVEVPTEQVLAAFDKIYRSLQKDIAVKGFRKGKAPMATIKSLYRDRVKGDVMNQLLQDSYFKALNEKALDPVGYPDFQVATLEEGSPFSFSAKFEVRPDVQLKSYEGLEVKKERFEPDPTHVDKVIANILNSHATRENVLEDRPVQKGDFALIDFEGFRDGQPVANTKAEQFELEIGSNSFIPGFEEGIEGARVGGSLELNLKFPETYHAKELAGTPITFKVKVHGLKKKVMPKVNDELAKRVGFESAAQMRENLEKDYRDSEEKRTGDELKNRLLKALVAKNPVEVPKSMLDEQKKLLADDVKGRLAQQGMGEEDFKGYVEKWDADFTETATFMIQSSFLIHALAEKENLAATPEDFQNKLEEYAKQTGIELSKLKTFYKEGENKSRLMFKLTEDKVVDFLKSKSKIKEVSKKDLE